MYGGFNVTAVVGPSEEDAAAWDNGREQRRRLRAIQRAMQAEFALISGHVNLNWNSEDKLWSVYLELRNSRSPGVQGEFVDFFFESGTVNEAQKAVIMRELERLIAEASR